jgi:hypothetical protein
MQLPNDIFVTLEIRNAEKNVGELSLGLAMRRQGTEHTRDDAHWSHPLVTKIQIQRFNPIA